MIMVSVQRNAGRQRVATVLFNLHWESSVMMDRRTAKLVPVALTAFEASVETALCNPRRNVMKARATVIQENVQRYVRKPGVVMASCNQARNAIIVVSPVSNANLRHAGMVSYSQAKSVMMV
jgi:hypothetical protein